MDRAFVRRMAATVVISVSLLTFLWLGLRSSIGGSPETLRAADSDVVFHEPETVTEASKTDFGRYILKSSLSSKQLGLDEHDSRRRLIIVGDIHGMKASLNILLHTLRYDPSNDTLVHLGDIVSKGPDSLAVLDFMSSNNILGVRGNHDQKVIGWRAWQEWVEMSGGKKWLKQVEQLGAHEFIKDKKKERHRWSFPDDWTWSSEQYWIARKMTSAHRNYLLSLPLILHIPSLELFLVHAGLLPASSQHFLPSSASPAPPPEEADLQDATSILSRVPANRDPWSLLNIRSVLPDGTVSRKFDGTPWSEVWNAAMSHAKEGERSTVVYGHAAAKGLDLKEWTKGLDSGCVYGKQLSAIVLGSGETEVEGEDVLIGQRRAKLVQVECS